MEITDINQLDFNKSYTYADYFSWKFQERVELLKGKIFRMSPAPNRFHQTILTDFGTELSYFLKSKPCQVFFGPFDVRLDRFVNDKQVQTVVQPDICVVCDLTKLDDRGCLGAPELVVEILSPGNTKKEMKYKFELYESSGVQEYLIVDPAEQVVWQYVLENGQFTNHRPLITEDTLKSSVLAGFEISVAAIFGSI
jgi:Uma2 family endonuclease